MSTPSVTNNEQKKRYELAADGGTGLAYYRLEDGVVNFTHTEVPEALQGQGIATRLIAGAIKDVRQRGLKLRPTCSFVRDYIERYEGDRDLLAD